MPQAPASSSKVCKYGAFFSFRGPDTRKNFVSHLYDALKQREVNVFKDDEGLEAGKSISYELLKAIEESKFAIVIFSESYASSQWCLEELAHIIKCRNELNQIVVPIFYNVNPSDVSHQNSPFAESFSQYEEKYKDDMEKVQRWREAFVESGKIAGYHLQNYKDEADCIKKVVDYILPNVISPVSESLVGTEIDKIMSLLRLGSDDDDVNSVGIRGMGGIEIACACAIRMTEMDCPSLSNFPILLDEGKLSFSLDKTGKKCFMVAARGLGIEWGNTPEYWEWSSHPDSRFSEVAKLRSVYWLDIRGKIETRIMSKRTKYAAFLVFKLEDEFHGLGTANAVVRLINYESDNDAEQRASTVRFSGLGLRANRPSKRGDGWMELKMGNFFNDKGEDGDVEARLMEISHLGRKCGLIIEGMEFRPL